MHSKIDRKTKRRGFTLIEIMVVVAILVILIGITVMVGNGVRTKSQEKYTRTTLEKLKGMMVEYYAAGNPEPSNRWFEALKANPKIADSMKGMEGFKDGKILDGYGEPIVYVPSTSNPATGALIRGGYFMSPGPDGKPGPLPPAAPNADSADNIFSDPIAP
jgi:prepilin-type N-terminal cleavage/methylation domain-containing protein